MTTHTTHHTTTQSATAPGPALATPADPELFVRPDWLTRHVLNPTIAWLTRRGVSVRGSRVLEVQGRRSGAWYATPVNLLTVEGCDYLVAARGNTQWARNARVNATVRLRLGSTVEEVTLVEVDAAQRPPILREYLRRWKAEVGKFFDGVDANSTDSELARIAPSHSVFRVATW